MKIVVLIVTFNGQKWISSCLDSLMECSMDLHIIIVDNASTDRTIEIIEREYTQCTLIKLAQNKGFGGANNMGLIRAMEGGADFILLMNQDARIVASTIPLLLEAATNHPGYGVLSPLHYASDGKKLDYFFYRFVSKDLKLDSDSPASVNRSQAVFPVSFVNAACWFVPTRAFREVGLFDPEFYQYGEDNDFINRIHYKGLKVGVCPSAVAFHDRDQDSIRIKSTSVSQNRSEVGYKVALLNPNQPFLLACFKTTEIALVNLAESILISPRIFVRELRVITGVIGLLPRLRARRKVRMGRPIEGKALDFS
jgi:GT2 family glycosyltransferase